MQFEFPIRRVRVRRLVLRGSRAGPWRGYLSGRGVGDPVLQGCARAHVLVSNDDVIRCADPVARIARPCEQRPALREYLDGRHWQTSVRQAIAPFHPTTCATRRDSRRSGRITTGTPRTCSGRVASLTPRWRASSTSDSVIGPAPCTIWRRRSSATPFPGAGHSGWTRRGRAGDARPRADRRLSLGRATLIARALRAARATADRARRLRTRRNRVLLGHHALARDRRSRL